MAHNHVERARRGPEHEIYTRRFLTIYDTVVLGFYLHWVWRCPRAVLADRYRTTTGVRHLDVGPGTGYFLDVAELPTGTEITLLDPNPDVLAHAAKRLARHAPATIQADACEPLPLTGSFETAALNLVLVGGLGNCPWLGHVRRRWDGMRNYVA
jgi:ubiquinone/menaquinone biosynthesis C-methylase UbiE